MADVNDNTAWLIDGSYFQFFDSDHPPTGVTLPPPISDIEIYAQRYDASGDAVGAPFLVNTTTFHFQGFPVVLQFDDGQFVVAWTLSQYGSVFAVQYQRFDANGDRIAGEVSISTTDAPIGTLELTSTQGNGFEIYSGRTGEKFLVANEVVANHMAYGAGNDIYVVDHVGDVVIERAFEGSDQINSTVSYALPANVEYLALSGSGAIDGTGNSKSNVLTGNGAANRLNGAAGNDTIFGGDGADSLRGGTGVDQLFGGVDASRDVFLFSSAAESAVGVARDVIFDFVAGVDTIDLRAIDANQSLAGNQSFHFNGNLAARYSIWWLQKADSVLIRGDVNGDKLADFEISAADVQVVGPGDFLL